MSRSNTPLAPALVAGLASSVLFIAAAALGLGFFFLFLSTLPLLLLGLRGQIRSCLIAGLFGTGPITILAGFDAGLMYFLYLALPCLYLAQQSLLRAHNHHESIWFPVGLPLMHLAIMGIVTIALMTGYYTSVDGGIMGIISQQIEGGLEGMEPEMAQMLKNVAQHWSFLVFGLTVWMWVLLLYAHLWAANRMLGLRKLRPSVAIYPFVMPGWIISLLAISALASLIGSPSMQFLGKSALVCLMLPYFLLGCALMHASSKDWPSRRFFLFFVYFMVIAQFWPSLVLAAVGFFSHIKSLSGGAPSARS